MSICLSGSKENSRGLPPLWGFFLGGSKLKKGAQARLVSSGVDGCPNAAMRLAGASRWLFLSKCGRGPWFKAVLVDPILVGKMGSYGIPFWGVSEFTTHYLEPILVGIWMFTGATIWLLTHGHMSQRLSFWGSQPLGSLLFLGVRGKWNPGLSSSKRIDCLICWFPLSVI